jgi:hypothetical protein
VSRLKYTTRGYVRLLQMSRYDVFVFAEGWTDRYFYDKLCELVFKDTGLTHQVRTSEEIDGPSTGKAALLEFLSYVRKRKLLFHEFKGKKLAVVFFLDKDLDDYFRVMKRSKHVVYTEYYCLENHLFRNSDLSDIAAAAALLDAEALRGVIGDQDAWLRRAASEWKEWIKLCFLTRRLRVNCRSNYRQHQSQVNAGAYGGTIAGNVAAIRAEILAASGLSPAEFDEIAKKTSRFVDKEFEEGRQDRLFKGKWYGRFLADAVDAAAAGRRYESNGLESRFLAIASSKLDLARPWGTHFIRPVQGVIGLF